MEENQLGTQLNDVNDAIRGITKKIMTRWCELTAGYPRLQSDFPVYTSESGEDYFLQTRTSEIQTSDEDDFDETSHWIKIVPVGDILQIIQNVRAQTPAIKSRAAKILQDRRKQLVALTVIADDCDD